MGSYLLIETKDPLDSGRYAFELGRQLRERNHEVSVYLLQDAVLAARRTFPAGQALLAEAHRAGLRVLVDAVSARQRGVTGERVAPGVTIADMPELVDLLMERADKVIWH